MRIMRIRPALLLFTALLAPAAGRGETAPSATATGILSPALSKLRTTLGKLRLEKWKAAGPVREQARTNIGSIGRDLDGTLPGLLTTADAAPGAVSQNLPVFRNVDALYDVLLRVVEAADLAAPTADSEALHGALTSLEDARRSLGDALEDAAVSTEAQVKSMTAQREAQTAAAAKPTPANVVDNTDAKPAAAPRRKKKTPPPPQ